MIYTFFESSYGYNMNVRLGKIYELGSRDTIRYLLEVHPDLIDKSYWIKMFIHKVKKYYRMRAICSRIRLEHIHNVQLGIQTWRQVFELIEKKL
jgi:hypothetical protein